MKIGRIVTWLDDLLDVASFDDVSNNSLQLERTGEDVSKVAFAVDASLESVRAAAAAKAQLLVVHHGISWGGGIRRITGGEYAVVKVAIDANLAIAAYHLPLDASKKVGNNYEIARSLGMKGLSPAFSYHGNVIGVVGRTGGLKVGVCSGGAGEFAVAAKELGCDLYVTGEANWGERIAAENLGMPMICAGHYETEVYGVRALMREAAKALGISTVFIERKKRDED